jgi:hypothetical protein
MRKTPSQSRYPLEGDDTSIFSLAREGVEVREVPEAQHRLGLRLIRWMRPRGLSTQQLDHQSR